MSELAHEVERALSEVEDLKRAREKARSFCVSAIRLLEGTLRRTLGDGRLRGLYHLSPDVRGVRVRGLPGTRLPSERKVLVLTDGGHLVMASQYGSALAIDEDLIAEDAEHVARAVVVALRAHLAETGGTEALDAVERLRDLAARIEASVAA